MTQKKSATRKSKEKYGHTVTTNISHEHYDKFKKLIDRYACENPHMTISEASLSRLYIIEGIERDWK